MNTQQSQSPPLRAKARARANIALAKYWGKIDPDLNLPAVPSLSITLDPLITETSVEFTDSISADTLILDGQPASTAEIQRIEQLVDAVRLQCGISLPVRVISENHFPTASGLASSASGFAALAAALVQATGLALNLSEVSVLARRCSASAARSVFGGFVALGAGNVGDDVLAARPLYPPEHWELCVVVAVTDEDRKKVGSSDGMNRTKQASPYYASWLETAPRLAEEIEQGIGQRDLYRLGPAMEKSTLAMHACAMATGSDLIYWQPATLAAWHRVRQLREDGGIGVWATVDAGPHLKAVCMAEDADRVQKELRQVPGVLRTIWARPGPGVEIL